MMKDKNTQITEMNAAFKNGYAAWAIYFASNWKVKAGNPYENRTDDWMLWNMGWNANYKGVDV